MVDWCRAQYSISQNGNATIKIQTTTPLKIRNVYGGTASLQFQWVSTGKTTSWRFNPSILNPTPVQFTQTTFENGIGQTTTVEFGNQIFPAAGIIKPNAVGAIRAPAVHIDIPWAYDLWIVLLRSPWFPLRFEFVKNPLAVTHGQFEATAYWRNVIGANEEKALQAEITAPTEGFSRIYLSVKRQLNGTSAEEVLGEAKPGISTFSWKPVLPNLDSIVVASSSMTLNQFLDFLRNLGAEKKTGSLLFAASYLPNDFILCDGPSFNYSLQLTGEKTPLTRAHDETRLTLMP